jgi:hypothetical protein
MRKIPSLLDERTLRAATTNLTEREKWEAWARATDDACVAGLDVGIGKERTVLILGRNVGKSTSGPMRVLQDEAVNLRDELRRELLVFGGHPNSIATRRRMHDHLSPLLLGR